MFESLFIQGSRDNNRTAGVCVNRCFQDNEPSPSPYSQTTNKPNPNPDRNTYPDPRETLRTKNNVTKMGCLIEYLPALGVRPSAQRRLCNYRFPSGQAQQYAHWRTPKKRKGRVPNSSIRGFLVQGTLHCSCKGSRRPISLMRTHNP